MEYAGIVSCKPLSQVQTLPYNSGQISRYDFPWRSRGGSLAAGSGKTSLLNALAGRLQKAGTLYGEILVNGKPRDNTFKRISAYVSIQPPPPVPLSSLLWAPQLHSLSDPIVQA
jgi:hypothetical protein